MASSSEYLVSVVIPAYNAAKFLPRCLDSVCHQTLKEIQIICVNDGSTDKSGEILQQYALKDSRLNIITQSNQGLSEARNHGLAEVRGKYVFFLDSDDYIHPQTLEIFYKTAEKTQTPVVISSHFFRLGKDKNFPGVFDADKISYKVCTHPLEDLYRNRFVSAVVWNKLYRADIARSFNFIKGIYFEDWPFTASIFSHINKFSMIDEKLYAYNTNYPSIVRSSFSIKKIADYITGIRYIHDYLIKQNKISEWKIVRYKRISVSLKMILSKISKSQENQKELEKYFIKEYRRLVREKMISFWDLSFKSKFRLLRILWHQRNENA